MRTKSSFVICMLAAGLLWMAFAYPVFASAPAQGIVVNTPTAQPDGRILYKVKSGDTCISISLIMKVPLDQLRALNNLKADCTLQLDQTLILGVVTPSAPAGTGGPTQTPTPLLPTPTQFNGTAQICVLLYEDLNGDALHEDGENAVPDGAVSLTDRLGKVALTQNTAAGTSPVCFDTVPEGDYNISVAVPQKYNPTTSMNMALKVQAGDKTTLNFGAQLNSQAAPVSTSEGGHSPILGLLGGALLLGGVVLGIYMWRSHTKSY
jgi:LysM repeat protein